MSGVSTHQGSAMPHQAAQIADEFILRLQRLLQNGIDATEVFSEDVAWKDILAFTWDLVTHTGVDQVGAAIAGAVERDGAPNVRLAASPAPRLTALGTREVLEVFFDFETSVGVGRGIARLQPDDGWRASSFFTAMQELRGHGPVGSRAPGSPARPTTPFGDPPADAAPVADTEVLIAGGGQNGLILAARLGRLGVGSLLVDGEERVGDTWRRRYESLHLHNQTWVCDMPYLPFPSAWPEYLPKDMVGDWLEVYAWSLGINVSTSTTLVGATYDEAARTWSATLDGAHGTRTVTCRHLVMATGFSGQPYVPDLPGLEEYQGTLQHSSDFRSGKEWGGRRAVVVGTGSSGHDIAQDLHEHGAKVTLVQRNPATVLSMPSAELAFAAYSGDLALDDCDLLSASLSRDALIESHQLLSAKVTQLDRDLLDRLNEAGFRTDQGEDESGFLIKYLRTGGGFYFNVGCSDLIADGEISVVASADIEAFDKSGLALVDGRHVDADLIVLCTGYSTVGQRVTELLGKEIAKKIGPIWGFDENGDICNVWRRTAQDRLWFSLGTFSQARTYSRYVALAIKADLEGLSETPQRIASEDHRTTSPSAP